MNRVERNRLSGVSLLVAAFALACGPTPSPSDSGTPDDAGQDAGSDAGNTSDAGQDAGGPYPVTFSYTPAWPGVTSVVVIGGFDAGMDWKAATPFATLTTDGGGTWTGAASPLPAGQYTYLLVANGDSAGKPTTTHLAIDPANTAYAPCPAGAPSYTTKVANPCSLLTVPQPTPPNLYHVTGAATFDGGAATGYLAVLERDEPSSHHYFVNRMDVRGDGTFDIEVAPGSYRVQVLYPTYYTQTDSQRDGLALNSFLRMLSGSFRVSADLDLTPTDLTFTQYDQYTPLDGGALLPATFTFPVIPGAVSAYAAVYGGLDGGLQNVGDPWWVGMGRTINPAADTFDGGWNTTQATETVARPGERYLWGTWQVFPRGDGGVQWVGESMVFPVVFQ